MVNYKQKIAETIMAALDGLTLDEVMEMVETPADNKMGDYAFPCFKLAKAMRKAPPVIAKEVAEKIRGNELFAKVENVNAYVNLFMEREPFMKDILSEVISKGDAFGRNEEGCGKKVIVEFSSPNIAKPFHIGHIRSTVIGNSIYKLYDFMGYETIRINHLGDYGTQFGKMICAYRRWGTKKT